MDINKGFLYFLNIDNNIYKVGTSIDVNRRAKTLKAKKIVFISEEMSFIYTKEIILLNKMISLKMKKLKHKKEYFILSDTDVLLVIDMLKRIKQHYTS